MTRKPPWLLSHLLDIALLCQLMSSVSKTIISYLDIFLAFFSPSRLCHPIFARGRNPQHEALFMNSLPQLHPLSLVPALQLSLKVPGSLSPLFWDVLHPRFHP